MNLFLVLCGSIIQSSLCAIISILCAFPLMHAARSVPNNMQSLLYSLLLMLAIMPGTMTAVSVSCFYSSSGILAVVLAHLLLNIPLAFHVLYCDFIRVDSTLYTVARCLGAGRVRSYYDGILLPLFSSLIRVFSVVFVLCFSSVSIPLLLGNSDWSVTLDSSLILLYGTENKISIFLCFTLRVLVILIVSGLGFRLSNLYKISYKTMPLLGDTTIPVHKGLIVIGYTVIVGLLLPVISLCVQFFLKLPWYNNQVFNILNESLFCIVLRSLLIAIASATTALSVALFSLYAQSCYATLLGTVPWLIGGSACAAFSALLASYLPIPSLAIVVGCHALLCFPFVMRMITVALNQYDKIWTQYAISCGATRWQIFVTLQLPYIKEAVSASWFLSFGLSLAQVGVSQLLVDYVGMTLPAAIRALKAGGSVDGAIILSICSMALVFIPAFFVQWVSSNKKCTAATLSFFLFSKSSRRVVERKRLKHST